MKAGIWSRLYSYRHVKSLCACFCLWSIGFHYPLYGKTAGREESEVSAPGRGGAVSGKQSSDSSSSSAMEMLQQQSHQYHGKSPAVRGFTATSTLQLTLLSFTDLRSP